MLSAKKINYKKLEKLRNRHQLELVLLHGSQAENKTHPDSDIDVAVLRKNKQTPLNINIYQELAAIFETDKIDVTDMTHANPLLLKTITDKAQLLAGKKDDLYKIQLKAFHLYSDYLPYFKREADFVRDKLKQH